MTEALEPLRWRTRYTKLGKVRFLGHRDLARVWERAIRRAGLPVAYTEGFSPRPKLHFGLALSVGHESFAEYLDIDLRNDAVVDGLRGSSVPSAGSEMSRVLDECLPVGIGVTAIEPVPRSTQALQASVTSSTWRLTVTADRGDLCGAVESLRAASTLPVEVERKGKLLTVDAREQIDRLEVTDDDPAGSDSRRCVVEVDLRRGERSLRPAELAELVSKAMGGIDLGEVRVLRCEQWIEDDRGRRPVLVAATRMPGGDVHASADEI